MARNQGMYSNYGGSSRKKRRRRGSGSPLIGMLLVAIVAVGLGFTAYHLSKKNLGERPDVSQLTPSKVPGEEGQELGSPGTGGPTQVASLTQMPENTPAAGGEQNITNVPTAGTEPTQGVTAGPTPGAATEPTPGTTTGPTPETSPGPTAEPTPDVTPTPAWNENYLIGFVDNRTKVDVKGAYAGLGIYGRDKLNEWLNLADTTELNALVIDIKADSGRVTYLMDNEAIAATGVTMAHFKNIHELLNTLKAHGIYTIARVVCFRDPYIGKVHPEYMLYTKDGEMYKDKDGITWMNPYNRDTWKYIIDVAEQAVKDGFDEICFDYIRVSTNGMSKVDFGDAYDGKELTETITAFTKYACNRLKPAGAFVSASVYGSVIKSEVDSKIIGQDYVGMSQYLDYICPMVYPSHYAAGYAGFSVPDAVPYELLYYEMTQSKNKLSVLEKQQDNYAIVRPWLQAFTASWVKGYIKYTGDVVRKQVQAVYDAGYTGFMYWNASTNYVDGCFLPK